MLLDQHTLPAPLSNAVEAFLGIPRMETKSADGASASRAGENRAGENRPHPMRARRTSADRLREALMKLAGGSGTCLNHEEKAWSSITFSGTRHEVTLRFEGAEAVADGEELMELLPEHEFTIPGQLVADATIREVDHRFGMHERLTITAVLLLLEES